MYRNIFSSLTVHCGSESTHPCPQPLLKSTLLFILTFFFCWPGWLKMCFFICSVKTLKTKEEALLHCDFRGFYCLFLCLIYNIFFHKLAFHSIMIILIIIVITWSVPSFSNPNDNPFIAYFTFCSPAKFILFTTYAMFTQSTLYKLKIPGPLNHKKIKRLCSQSTLCKLNCT